MYILVSGVDLGYLEGIDDSQTSQLRLHPVLSAGQSKDTVNPLDTVAISPIKELDIISFNSDDASNVTADDQHPDQQLEIED